MTDRSSEFTAVGPDEVVLAAKQRVDAALCPSKSLPNVEPKPDEGPATRYQFYATAMILP